MNEKANMNKRLLKNMLINFIVFTVMFLIFDLIIYYQVSNSLFKTIDEELMAAQERYLKSEDTGTFEGRNVDIDLSLIQASNVIDEKLTDTKEKQDIMQGIPNDKLEDEKPEVEKVDNPRLIHINRDSEGNITNSDEIGTIYAVYGDNIPFDSTNLLKIYTIELSDEYAYRGINVKTTEDGEEIYVQILANVDGEVQTLKNVANTLIFGTAILVTISIAASYVLSKRAMQPIYEAYEKQTEFVQNASHELRTPLTIIQAKQELLLQEPDKKIIDKSEEINLTLKETKRLTKMIKELMTLARADSDKYELNKEVTNIDELIKETVAPYVDYSKLEGKEVVLDLQYKKEISIDKNKISQLFIILLDNAIKYTAKGDTITIKTYSKDGKCNIEVQDTGIGISDEAIGKIFDRFYREDKARSRETGGTGLGLSIARTIVTSHGGSIKALHNNPKGSIFYIKL